MSVAHKAAKFSVRIHWANFWDYTYFPEIWRYKNLETKFLFIWSQSSKNRKYTWNIYPWFDAWSVWNSVNAKLIHIIITFVYQLLCCNLCNFFWSSYHIYVVEENNHLPRILHSLSIKCNVTSNIMICLYYLTILRWLCSTSPCLFNTSCWC